MENKARVYLFSDGSCGAGVAGEGDIGSYATLLATATERKLLYGVVYPSTISRLELIPIIEGLRWLKKDWCKFLKGVNVSIYSDSELIIKTLSNLFTPQANLDLWVQFAEVSKDFNLTFTWYERNKLPYMELCDSTCSTLRTVLKDTANKLFGDYNKAADSLPFANLPT